MVSNWACTRPALTSGALTVPGFQDHRPIPRPARRVVWRVKDVHSLLIHMTVPIKPAQAALPHLLLNGQEILAIQVHRTVELGGAVLPRVNTPSVT